MICFVVLFDGLLSRVHVIERPQDTPNKTAQQGRFMPHNGKYVIRPTQIVGTAKQKCPSKFRSKNSDTIVIAAAGAHTSAAVLLHAFIT